MIYLQSIRSQFYSTIVCDISTNSPLSSTNKTDRHNVHVLSISADNSLSYTNESDISDNSTGNQRIYECTYLSTKEWATHRFHRWWILGAP